MESGDNPYAFVSQEEDKSAGDYETNGAIQLGNNHHDKSIVNQPYLELTSDGIIKGEMSHVKESKNGDNKGRVNQEGLEIFPGDQEDFLSYDLELLFNAELEDVERNRRILIRNTINLLKDCQFLAEYLEIEQKDKPQLKVIEWKSLSSSFREWAYYLAWIIKNGPTSDCSSTGTNGLEEKLQWEMGRYMRSVSRFSSKVSTLKFNNKGRIRSPNLRFHFDMLEHLIQTGFKWANQLWQLNIEWQSEETDHISLFDRIKEITLETLVKIELDGIKLNSRPYYEINLYYKNCAAPGAAITFGLANGGNESRDWLDSFTRNSERFLLSETLYGLKLNFTGWPLGPNSIDWESLFELLFVALKKQLTTLERITAYIARGLTTLSESRILDYCSIPSKEEWDRELWARLKKFTLLQFAAAIRADCALQRNLRSFEIHYYVITKWMFQLAKFLSSTKEDSLMRIKFKPKNGTIFEEDEVEDENEEKVNFKQVQFHLEIDGNAKWKSLSNFIEFLKKQGQQGYFDSFCSDPSNTPISSNGGNIDTLPSSLKNVHSDINKGFALLYDTFEKDGPFNIIQSSMLAFTASMIILHLKPTSVPLPPIVKKEIETLLEKVKKQIKLGKSTLKNLKVKIDSEMKLLDEKLNELIPKGAEFHYDTAYIKIHRKEMSLPRKESTWKSLTTQKNNNRIGYTRQYYVHVSDYNMRD